MQLTSLSLALTRAGFLTFSPSALFAAGEQGAWYDPSDLTTLFQDSAGTTPVTAVEQPVGRLLDKSKGLVLGPDVLDGKGSFANPSDWTAPVAGASISGGVLAFDGTTSIGGGVLVTAVSPAITLVSGKTYQITYTINGGTTNPVSVGLTNGGILGTARTAAGTYTELVSPTSTASIQVLTRVSAGIRTGSIDNISVRELPGNHAFQSTAASRPVLSARYNLLTKTEDLLDAIWTKISATVTSAPDSNAPGAMYAVNSANDSISSSTRYVAQTVTVAASTQHTARFYAKAGTSTALRFMTRNDDALREAFFSLTGDGAVTSTGGGVTATISSIGNGIYLCAVTWTTGADTSILYTFNAGASTFGNGSVMFYVSAPDFRASNAAAGQPVYQRVNTSTDYDTAGFPLYLAFDGVDDWLQTNSIDFTGTDKMTVFAGVRKLSDAATAILFETSTSIGSNNGVIQLAAPISASANYQFSSKGTISSNASYTNAAIAAPVTSVLSSSADIPGDSVVFRVNGAQVATSTVDQGTGNYGNYPLYIGRRGGTTLPFNGRLYGLIVRGAASTAQQITQAESWMNSKTRAF